MASDGESLALEGWDANERTSAQQGDVWATSSRPPGGPTHAGAPLKEETMTVAGILATQARAQEATAALQDAGFTPEQIALMASPTSAAELLRGTEWQVPESVIRDVEAGVAQGQILVTVEAPNEAIAAEAERILSAHEADHVYVAPAPPAQPAQ